MKTSASVSVQYDNIFSPFPGAEWERGLIWAREQGFDGVELILSDPNLLDADKLVRTMERCKLEAATISTGQAMALEGLSMTSASESVREAAYRRLKNDVDFSVRIGSPNVTIGLIRGRGGVISPEIEYNLLVNELLRIAEYAGNRGVNLNLEPINRYECKLINSTDEGARLLEDIGSPAHVGILYDAFHSNIEDADCFDAAYRNIAKISHVHLADSNRHLPGEGHFDFPRLFKILRESGYQGYVSLEVLNRPSAEHIREFAGKRLKEEMEANFARQI